MKKRKEKKSEGGTTGRWTKEEHKLFIEALNFYGKNWNKVQRYVGTRTTTQARSHAQKYFAKLEKQSSSSRKNNYSVSLTAVNSPASRSENTVKKKTLEKRISEEVNNQIELPSEENISEDQLDLEETKSQGADNFIFNAPRNAADECIKLIDFNEVLVQDPSLVQYEANIDQEQNQGTDIEFDVDFKEEERLELLGDN